MKREELIAMGLSEENADKIIAEHAKVVQSANAKADKFKTDAQKAEELQKELDRINSEKLSEEEKTRAELEQANNRIAELERIDAIRNQRSLAMEKFKVDSEQAKQIVKDDGSFDYDILGQIISDKETAAATAKEQEIAKKATNPGGLGGDGGGKNIATEMAVASAKRAGAVNESILKNYRR